MNTIKDSILQGNTLLDLLGTFWSQHYANWNQIASYINAKNQVELQSFQELNEIADSLSRFNIPIYKLREWSLLRLIKSQRLLDLITYGEDNIVFGDNFVGSGIVHEFGVTDNLGVYSYALPNNLVNCSLIQNKITEPTVSFINNVDYVIDANIHFRANPFSNPKLTPLPIYDNKGNLVDYYIDLWLFKANYDESYEYNNYGYAFNFNYKTSEEYKDLVNVLYDNTIIGSYKKALTTLLAVITDNPLSKDNETIIDISKDKTSQLVITDKNVYHLALDANLIVSANQVLAKDQLLTDAFVIYYPVTDVPTVDEVPALSIGREFLLGSFASELTFNNKITNLKVTTDASSRTRIEFDIGGSSSDKKLFWDTVHTNGTAMGATSLAQLLDFRYPPAQSPDPTAVNLPITINPLMFLIKNVFRNNVLIVRLNNISFGDNYFNQPMAPLLKAIVPPSNLIIFLVYLDIDDLISADTDLTEDLTSDFESPNPLTESSPHSFLGSETFTFS